MKKKIEISCELYERLAEHAIGFETPEQVIEKILDAYELKSNMQKPQVIFLPDEENFRKALIKNKHAWKIIEYITGEKNIEEWAAEQFNHDSNLRANIWSGPLRGWRQKNIASLTLTSDKPLNENYTKSMEMNNMIEIQVGNFIKAHLNSIIEYCNDHPEHLTELMSKKWSKENIGISFAFVMLAERIREQKLEERYWKKTYSLKHKNVRFCSQFGGNQEIENKSASEFRGQKVIQYLKLKNLLLPEYKEKNIKFIVKSPLDNI